ncbi:IclR family transcriptional regulator [Roseomonas chloroacetimidivorans]|uniref:IclR family transcriptional regulator n=1 Tax=Roseomonas chloroacetimidivorans TaxID=1766656 RepID=UPI003C74286D
MPADPSVKSATRVFEILEYFSEVRRPLRLKDFVDHSGYPVSSTAALLKTMTAQGYLTFDRVARTYLPTLKLLRLVGCISSAAYESGPVLDAMRNLQQSTGELIVLGTVNDIHVEYVEALRSTQDIQLWSPPGTKRLLVQSALGWMLLSELPSRVVERIFRRTVALGKISEAELPLHALFTRLEACRQAGHIFPMPTDYVRTPAQPGGAIIATTAPTAPGQRPLAIGVGGPATRLRENMDHIVQEMRREMLVLEGVIMPSSESSASTLNDL